VIKVAAQKTQNRQTVPQNTPSNDYNAGRADKTYDSIASNGENRGGTRFDRWIDEGFQLIPLNSQCHPLKSWKEAMEERPEREKLRKELKMTRNAAVVCGRVSGNLVVLDCDDPRIAEKLELETLTVRTPSSGLHLYVRSQRVPEKKQGYNEYALDVQGERSYAIAPPSERKGVEGKPDGRYEIVKDLPIREFEDILEYLDEKLPPITEEREINVERFKDEIGTEILKEWVTPECSGHGYWQGRCPFHNERNPSFTVYRDGYYCYGCGRHGDIIAFVMEHESVGFREAIQILSEKTGVPPPTATKKSRKEKRQNKRERRRRGKESKFMMLWTL